MAWLRHRPVYEEIPMEHDQTRRQFLSTAGGIVGLSLVPTRGAAQQAAKPPADMVILFQGDSITDAGRDRSATEPNRADALGRGYPFLVASGALATHPDRSLVFHNRGISGNKVPDLRSRWEADALQLRPEVLSILIGVNDIWHKLNGRYSGTVQDYESEYDALLAQTRRTLPATRLVVLEPFVLRAGAVNDDWFPEFDQRRAAARRVAERAGAVFVPLQEMFDSRAMQAPPEYWAADGVHPTLAGHAAIADLWRATVGI
jgi:lysophospholipase L1-like esterase